MWETRPHELHLGITAAFEPLGQLQRGEGGLTEDAVAALPGAAGLAIELPTRLAHQTVGDGEPAPLLGAGIVPAVGVIGKGHVVSGGAVLRDAAGDGAVQALCPGKPRAPSTKSF